MLVLGVVCAYLALLLAVGVVKSRQVHGQTGFTLAGGKLGPLVMVGTLLATWTGTGSIFGNAEEAWRVGLPALLLPFAAVAGILVLVVMSGRVRALGRFTLQDVLEERFGVGARALGSLTLVLAYLIIVSYQLRAAAAVLDGVLDHAGLPGLGGSSGAVLVVALMVGVYTALAGMMSVAVTDTFNGLLMTVGVGLALPFVWSRAGGMEGVLAAFPEEGRRLGGHYGAFDMASILLPSFLLILGDANLHQRFLSARSDGVARRAAWMLIPGVLVVDAVIILTAVGGRALLPDLANPGHVILRLGLDVLPAGLGALLVASILAVIISTADSYLLSSSASLVRDVYQRFIRPDADEARLLTMARVSVAVLTATAFGLTFTSDAFFDVALFAYTIYGVGITPVLLAALFWPRATPAGALSGMVTGAGTAIAWKVAGGSAWAAGLLALPEGARVGAVVPAVLAATLVMVGVSLVTRPRR